MSETLNSPHPIGYGMKVRVKRTPKLYREVCPVCGMEIVSLYRRQAEANLKSHMLRHSK